MMLGLAFGIEKLISDNEIAIFFLIAFENLEWETRLVDLFEYSVAVVTYIKR